MYFENVNFLEYVIFMIKCGFLALCVFSKPFQFFRTLSQNCNFCLKTKYILTQFNISILAFSTNFCPLKIDLSGNTLGPIASRFLKLAKMYLFGIFNELLSTYNVVFEVFPFWHFLPIFVLLKLTCLVTLFDRKLQAFKNSPNGLFLAFLMNFC